MKKLKNLLKKEKGITTVEWLIIIAAVAVLATAVVNLLGGKITDLAERAGASIEGSGYEESDSGDDNP